MKFKISPHRKKKIYSEHLCVFKDIKFTVREIDIIACILHNRGEKKIAFLLTISPRTVSTHVRNIMLKLGNNSKERIIDFVEKSGKLSFFREYYLQLLVQSSFENQLIKITKNINPQSIICNINQEEINAEEKHFLDQLKEHLKLANVILEDAAQEASKGKQKIDILTDKLSENGNQVDKIFILINQGNNYYANSNIKFLNFTIEEEYYFTVFELLKRILNHDSLNDISAEFSKEYDTINNSLTAQNPEVKELNFVRQIPEGVKSKNSIILLFVIFCCCLLMVRWPITQKFSISASPGDQVKISSDLPLPNDAILLARLSILEEIEKKLNNKNGIKTVALVGTGGCGKTTIARRYARNQKSPIIWEINAETKDSIIFSFEQLAYSLCVSEEEKQELAVIQKLKNSSEHEERLLLFVKIRIKNYPDWLIIYNNVGTFRDIQKYFPHDAKAWGNGKVIITTCDSNIVHNSYIWPENVIRVEELSREEKFDLFTKILSNSVYNEDNKTPDISFLEKIPPFPLDVSVAAYYIKEGKLSYNEYLKNIDEPNKDFDSIQEIILNDIGEYTKTRYDIVILSIKEFLNNKDFKDLLLLVSMIDPQEIPKDLLTMYKDEITVSKFIHELKKYSFISENQSKTNELTATFSIHRSTQTIALEYLKKALKLKNNAKQLEEISLALKNYIAREAKTSNSGRMPLLVSHIEAFLNHAPQLNKLSSSSLSNELGIYYFQAGNYEKAKKLFMQSHIIYKEYYGIDHIETAKVSAYLGKVHRNMGNYKTAEKLLEQAHAIYKKRYTDDPMKVAWLSTYLGSVYRNVGKYRQAKELLEHAYITYKADKGGDHIRVAWTAGYLGNVYKNLGNYKRAGELLEEASSVYEKYYGLDHTKTAWVLARQGILYRDCGDYIKAKELMEQALAIYKKHYGENSVETAWVLLYLGSIYRNLGDNLKAHEFIKQSLSIYNNNQIADNHIIASWASLELGHIYNDQRDYEKAKNLLQKSLEIHKLYYGENHSKTAGVLMILGRNSFLTGNLEQSESYVNKALKVLTVENHIDQYIGLELLADIYTKKYELEKNYENKQDYRDKVIKCLTHALTLIEQRLLPTNTHAQRLQLKLNRIQEL